MSFRALIILLLSLGPAVMSARTEMTVNPANDITEQWGTERTERYDVAFRLSDLSLVGAYITAVSIPFASNDAITDCSVWLTRELGLEDGQNKPDIFQIAVTPVSGYLSAILPNPVTLTEEGCYIGFSFTVNELDDYTKAPVTVSPVSQPGDMYIHTSRRYLKWGTQNLPLTPDMYITLSGEFHPDAVTVISLPEVGSLRGEPATTIAMLRNHGINEVSSIDFRIDLNDDPIVRHIDFTPPLLTHYFADVPLTVELDSDLDAGSYPISLIITEVNGKQNEASVEEMNSHLFIYPYLPERIPLMEEYTGTWCGWCPRGIVGMERMSELFPDKFVYAAYHRDKDPMNTVEEVTTPYKGAPSGYLDRVLSVDPYNGTSSETVATAMDGIGKAWQQRCDAITTGDISATATWTDSNHEVITVNSKVIFVRDYYYPRFRIGYLLTADALRGETPAWIQSNYFSGEDLYSDTELIEFVEKPSHVTDMSYDGVVVIASPLTGVEDSLPESIQMEAPLTHSFTFNLTEAVNYLGDALPIDKEKLKVIAYIVDMVTGEIVNCDWCAVRDEAAVETVEVAPYTIQFNNGYIIIRGLNGSASATLYSASGSFLDRAAGLEEIIFRKPVIPGVYLLTIDGRSKKIIL